MEYFQNISIWPETMRATICLCIDMHLLQPLPYVKELVAKFRSMTEMALTTVIGVKSKRSQCFEYWLLYKAAVEDL